MKKWIILLIVAVVLAAGFIWKNTAPSQEARTTPNPQSSFNESKGNEAIFLEFITDTCPYCVQMEPVISELSEEYRDKMKFIIANVSANEGAVDLARSFQVQGVPTVIIFSQKGEEEARFVGYQEKGALEAAIKNIIP